VSYYPGVPIVAIVREVSSSFERALASVAPDPPIDVARARAQHAAYVAALRAAGAEVVVLPAEDALPDACFVEDCAVVAGGVALIARPGAASRRDEPPAVRAAIAARMPVRDIARARAVFGEVGVEVIEVDVRGALHLKSACSPLGDETVLLAEGTLPQGTFGAARVLSVPELAAANAVVVGRHALVPAGFASAARAATAAGLVPLAVDNSELRKADSALTCMSILLDA
jgi:dimethylargininase